MPNVITKCTAPHHTYLPSLAAHTARRERARAAGQPPRRELQFSDAMSFRAARATWFEQYTGHPLDVVGVLAQQRRAWDNVTRAWRAYTDGRYSLGAPIWDGCVSRRDWRKQDGNAVAINRSAVCCVAVCESCVSHSTCR